MHIFLTVLEAATNRVWHVICLVLSHSEELKNWAETIGIMVGGFWALWRFGLRRERKPALDIALTLKIIPETEERFLAFFDVTLTNKSTRQVLARIRKAGRPAFKDRNETLQHSCSLLLRRVPPETPQDKLVRWFADADAKSPLPTHEANLLDDYEYEEPGRKEFWMEPSESYHLGVGIRLQPGVYLAMVTFVGQESLWRRLLAFVRLLGAKVPFVGKWIDVYQRSDEFWRRLFIVEIPERDALPSKESTMSRPSTI